MFNDSGGNRTYIHVETTGILVVVTFTHRHDTIESVVAGQAPITLEWEKYLGRVPT